MIQLLNSRRILILDIVNNKLNLIDFCKLIDIPFELLIKVKDNQEFVARQLAEQKPGNTILKTIDEFILEQDKKVLNEEINDRTRKNYVDFLVKFRKFILLEYPQNDVSTLDKDKAMQYINQCEKHRKKEDLDKKTISPNTKNAYLKYIRGLLYFALDKGYMYHKNGKFHIRDKFPFFKISQLPRSIPDELVRLILDEARKTVNPYRNHAMLCFLFSTGVRVFELVKVRICDIDFAKKMIKITGKNKKTRYITIYPIFEKVLRGYCELNNIQDFRSQEYLFTTNYNKTINQISVSAVQDMMTAILKKLGKLNEYSVHCCRHTFAVNCLKAGMPPQVIAELLGHTNVETTQIYLRLVPEDLVLEAQKYPIPLEKILFTLFNTEDES